MFKYLPVRVTSDENRTLFPYSSCTMLVLRFQICMYPFPGGKPTILGRKLQQFEGYGDTSVYHGRVSDDLRSRGNVHFERRIVKYRNPGFCGIGAKTRVDF